jgi:Undecaprenyl-phosphate glucose phosphotransferase
MEQRTIAELDKKRGPFSLLGLNLENLQLSRPVLVDIVAMIDMILVILDGFLIRYIYLQWYYNNVGSSEAGWLNYFSVTALVAVVLYAALQWREHYNYEDFEDWTAWHGGFRLAVTVLFAFGFSLFIVFMLKESAQFSRVWVLSWCGSSFLILFASRLFWIAQFKMFAKKGLFRRRVFLIGSGPILGSVRASLLSAESNVEIVGVSDLDGVCNTDEQNSRASLAVAINKAVSKGLSGSLDEVLIALCGSDTALLDPIISRLRMLPIDLKVALDLGAYKYKALELCQMGATNTVSLQKKPISDWNIFIKALEDYVLASLSLIIFLPAMALIAVLIKLDSKGPVFFRQRRHGLNHKVIEVLKFRTMSVLEDGETIRQATKNDSRVTRVGRFLRRSSLDELPQLLNVLTGDMSLVGPRPHALAHNNYYSEMLENYASRHRVKPGITGWAQVNGLRGEIIEPSLMEERVRYDLEYIDDWSIWLDLQILFMTPLFGFLSRRAY